MREVKIKVFLRLQNHSWQRLSTRAIILWHMRTTVDSVPFRSVFGQLLFQFLNPSLEVIVCEVPLGDTALVGDNNNQQISLVEQLDCRNRERVEGEIEDIA